MASNRNTQNTVNYEKSTMDETLEVPHRSTNKLDSVTDTHESPTEANEKAIEPAIAPPVPLDWDDEDDPDNPFNWSLAKRALNTIVPGLLGLAVTFGSSVYTPSAPEVAAHFHVSRVAAFLPLSLWTFGLGFGPLLGAPLSEMHGRKIVYLTSTPISLLFSMGSGLSTTFGGLLACRLLGGLFGSPILAVGAGSVNDLYPAQKRARGVALFVASPFLGPALGPFVGGFSSMNKGWRFTNWDELIALGTAWLLTFFLSESYKKIILRRRALRRHQEVPPAPPIPFKMLMQMLVLRPFYMLALEPIVLFFSFYIAFAFAVLFAFFAAFPLVFEGVYHMNPGESGLAFLGVGLGVIIAAGTSVLIDKYIYRKKFNEAVAAGMARPDAEHRLYSAMIGSVGLPTGLFWFAWTARASVHWISPIIAGVFFGWGNFSIFISCALYLGDSYGPLLAASAMAANGLLRYTLGAAFPLFTLQMYEKLGIAWATSLFGFVSIAMMPIPFVLYKYGPQLRARSRYKITP